MVDPERLTDQERALLDTARDLAFRFARSRRPPIYQADPKGTLYPGFGIADQTRILALSGELGEMHNRVLPVLESIVKAERSARSWLVNHPDFGNQGGSFRTLAPLLSALAGRGPLFCAPTVAMLFEMLWFMRDHGEPDAFRDVARVLCPKIVGKRRPFIERTRDGAELRDFREINFELRAANQTVPRKIRKATRINEILADKPLVYRAEICDALARYRKHRKHLTLLQLASLIWKIAERPRRFGFTLYYTSPPPHAETGVATAPDGDARSAAYEVRALQTRIRVAKKSEKSDRKTRDSD